MRRASNACCAPPRSSQRTLSSSVSARLMRISVWPLRRVSSTRLAGGEPERKMVASARYRRSCRLALATSSAVGPTLMIAGTLPRSISADDRAAIICARNGVSAIGGDKPHELAAMGKEPAREIIDLVSQRVGRLLHPCQRGRRDAGAGGEGSRDGGSGDPGAFARHPARSRTAAGHCLCFRASAQPRPSRLDHRSKRHS